MRAATRENETVLFMPKSLDIKSVSVFWSHLNAVPKHHELVIDFSRLERLDSSGVSLFSLIARHQPQPRLQNLGQWAQHLPAPISSQAATSATAASSPSKNIPLTLGSWAVHLASRITSTASLIADSLYHVCATIWARRGVQKGDMAQQIYLMGYKSLSITSIISLLVGLTISLTTAAQLRLLGGDIYLPSIAGFAMIKELVPIMTGIILAGKTGASITAEISTMKVMEEIDALRTMGIDPVRFLMAPRLMAITIAVPLLLVCANCAGLLGCIAVGKVYSSIPVNVFLSEIQGIITLSDILLATMKTLVFGWAIVLVSGASGLKASGGAEGVGLATTNAVLWSVTSIIVIDCLFALVVYF